MHKYLYICKYKLTLVFLLTNLKLKIKRIEIKSNLFKINKLIKKNFLEKNLHKDLDREKFSLSN